MRFSFLKARRGSCINQEDPPRGGGKQFQRTYFFLLSLHIFAYLIIGEEVNPSSSNHPFAGLPCAVDAQGFKQSRK